MATSDTTNSRDSLVIMMDMEIGIKIASETRGTTNSEDSLTIMMDIETGIGTGIRIKTGGIKI